MTSSTLNDIHNVAEAISSICNDCQLALSVTEAYNLLLIIQCNAHKILDKDETPIALGLFPTISMLNHSCTPNCIHHFIVEKNQIPKLIIRVINDIKIGDEICYSYVPLYAATSIRRYKLQLAYSFICSCNRCESQDTSTTTNSSGSTTTTTPTTSEMITRSNSINYPNDECISFHESDLINIDNNKIINEINMCQRLCISSIKASKSVIKKLQLLLSSSSDKSNHIQCCKDIMITAYITICKAVYNILISSDVIINNEMVSLVELSIAYGFLAISCVFYFTKIFHSPEILQLLDYVICAMKAIKLNIYTNNNNIYVSFNELNDSGLTDTTRNDNKSSDSELRMYVVDLLHKYNYIWSNDSLVEIMISNLHLSASIDIVSAFESYSANSSTSKCK
jgi:hypothetical protein